MARRKYDNRQVIAALLCTPACGQAPTVTEDGYLTDAANPWAVQAELDFQMLREFEDGFTVWEACCGRIIHALTGGECSDAFAWLDLGGLRAHLWGSLHERLPQRKAPNSRSGVGPFVR